MAHILDNPVWSALTTGNNNIAQGTDKIKFYRLDIAPFAGLEENSHDNLLALYQLNSGVTDGFAVVSTKTMTIPDPWMSSPGIPLLQMVCEQPVSHKEVTTSLVDLTDKHIPQMLALAKLANPGPFRERTIEFGHYQGIFDGEQLVAMAGQRMHANPYAEISAVCTHPDHTGRGYARQLMLSQIERINGAGEIPFLHVAATNERAIRIYESLGFVSRKDLFIYFIKK